MAEETETPLGSPSPGAGGGGTPAGSTAPAPAPQPPVDENRVPQSVVDRITRERWDATRRAEEAERKLALAQATLEEMHSISDTRSTPPASRPAAAAPREEPRRALSAEELRNLVAQETEMQQFNKACNEAVEAGRAAHNDFDKVVLQELTRLSPVYDPRAGSPILPKPLVDAVLETGNAGDVLYALGKDPATAERIMRLPPIKQAMEIAKFHDKLLAARTAPTADDSVDDSEHDVNADEPAPARVKPVENISQAPAPIRAAAGRRATGSTHAAFDINDPSKSSTKEWIAQREAQLARDRQNGVRRR